MQSSLTVTDHHMFHICSQFDVDLFQCPFGTRKNPSSLLCQTVLILYFSFAFVFKIFAALLSRFLLFVYFSLFTVTVLQSIRLAPLLTCPEMLLGREGTALYPYIMYKAQDFAVPICCGIPINNVWQKAAPRPAHLTFQRRESRQKQTTPLDTRAQSNSVQRGWNEAFHSQSLGELIPAQLTPTLGLAHAAWKEINGKGFNRLTIIGLIV